MKTLLKLFLCCFLLSVISCSKLPDNQPDNSDKGNGAFIVNEGKFLSGNGTLSFFSYDSMKIYNDLFQEYNNRPLGDVPYSMVAFGDNLYIIVNNSGKIEIINRNTYLSEGTITGLISPRKMAIIDAGKAYVTSLYSDSIAIVDLANETVKGYINMGKTSEDIIVKGNTAYVANWFGGNKVFVINTTLDKIKDSITVGLEPESMAFDMYNRLWVLCTGGWMKTQNAEIDVIRTDRLEVATKHVFPSKTDDPSCLRADETGMSVYYLNHGLYHMDINSGELPANPWISESDEQVFYKIAVNQFNGDVFISDAADYIREGFLRIYKKDGTMISELNAGLIPGEVCFNLKAGQNQISYLP